ncbi:MULTISPECIES: HAD-IA family hydrolase [unclassified Clostridium]|uniref:HAD family hydrolase n=1 Tax=unclassified Clostridium TaxID=2614128 RepID=UPI00207A4A6C|nr:MULTISPECIES: HAD-IA family hydrolase [unclassified Clostridium]
MVRLIIFDLDDTLYYEKEYVLCAFKDVANYLGNKYNKKTILLYERMKEIFKKQGRGKIFNIICKENNFNEDITKLIDIYRNCKPKLNLYNDSIEILKWLRTKRYKIGIITDGCARVQWNKIKGLDIEDTVDRITVTDDIGREFWKPHKKSYLDMMEYFNVDKNKCVYIGDNPNKDFIGAKELGIKTIRIIRENGDHIHTFLEEKYEADFNINNLLELKSLLEKMN